ncbi:MAG TPA: hypothetical protein VG013_17670 [Gemmataceae bacterium]|jgi:predicted DNA-binding transcriptional regulator AlpA|nr:hypothetical protein [Gemmataceae bacterium]
MSNNGLSRTTDPVEDLRDRPEAGRSEAPPIEVLLVGRKEAATLAGVSRATWDRLSAAGKTPLPLKLNARTLWRRADLQLWVALGLPDRKTFAALAAVKTNGRT